MKSLVVGRPILLALEDIDGSPSFLEKALCFIEQHGIVSITIQISDFTVFMLENSSEN